jgi:NAD(P)-dependent dehydrogenase (short-subunit alcohol dehydrogenase family)
MRKPQMSETRKLQGKVAVITGGTTGIGLATAKLFVKEGAYVFITGRRQKELDAAAKAIGSNVTGVQGDIAKLADLDRLYEAVKANGKLDIVFANAGVAEFAPLGKSPRSILTSSSTLTSREHYSLCRKPCRYSTMVARLSSIAR